MPDLSAQRVSSQTRYRLAKGRWTIENQGFKPAPQAHVSLVVGMGAHQEVEGGRLTVSRPVLRGGKAIGSVVLVRRISTPQRSLEGAELEI